MCSSDYYGERCQFKCQCQNGGLCNLKNGKYDSNVNEKINI